MTTNAFHASLNDFCRKYFVVGQKPLTAQDIAAQPLLAVTEAATLFEHLLLFDHVSLKIYGENVPLAFLYRQFGEKGLESLLEQEGLKFVLWTPMILHFVTDVPGVNPLGFGNHNSPAHSDPEASLDLGLNWLTEKPPKYVLKRLKRKALPLYEMPPPELAGQAVEVVHSAFQSGKLKPLGLDPQKQDLQNLKQPERALLGRCAERLLEYRFLMSRGMTSLSSFEYFSLFSNSLDRISSSARVTSGFSELAKLEGMPNLKALFPTVPNALALVPSLRQKRTSRILAAISAGKSLGTRNDHAREAHSMLSLPDYARRHGEDDRK